MSASAAHRRPYATAESPAGGSGRFDMPPYPTGWYQVAASQELRQGQVKTLRCLGRDLVLFRAADRQATVLDAYCPHLGTHLGHCGRVVDGGLECGFHGWRFDAAGRCTHVPAASVIPHRAQLAAWPVREVNGAIMLWFDQGGQKPLWDPPVIPEIGAPDWSTPRPTRTRIVRTHIQELAENGVDQAHFTAIHGRQIAQVAADGLTIEGPVLSHSMRNGFRHRISKGIGGLGRHAPTDMRLPGSLRFTYYGLGTMVCRAAVAGRFPVESVTVLYFLPLDEDRVQVSGALSMRRWGVVTRLLLAIAARETERAIADDTAVLETKRYLSRPLLSDADGPIMQYRKWARQFYASSMTVSG